AAAQAEAAVSVENNANTNAPSTQANGTDINASEAGNGAAAEGGESEASADPRAVAEEAFDSEKISKTETSALEARFKRVEVALKQARSSGADSELIGNLLAEEERLDQALTNRDNAAYIQGVSEDAMPGKKNTASARESNKKSRHARNSGRAELDGSDTISEAELSARTFSYEELVSKGNLRGVVVKNSVTVPRNSDGSIDVKTIVSAVKDKCQTVAMNGGGTTYFVNAPDINRNVEITTDGIKHGFIKQKENTDGNLPSRSRINALVATEIPFILQNSIEVNRSQRGSNLDNPFSRVFIGTVGIEQADKSIEYYAVRSVIEERINQNPILVEASVFGKLYSVNAKKVGPPDARDVKNNVALTHSAAYKYSIAHFLEKCQGGI
ncbi:MAG: hypothetical protein IJY04_03765, partial [Clostridia bacterium]|nr:hypothetical protein [Clostridia bacterium]